MPSSPSGAADGTPGATRLRVLAITPLFPNAVQPERGIFNAQVLVQLAVRAEVRVVAPVRWFPGAALTRAPERDLTGIPSTGHYRGIPVLHPRYLRIPRLARRWHGWIHAVALGPTLSRMVREQRPDVLLASWAYPDGFAAQRLGERLGLPVVVQCLGSDLHQFLDDPPRRTRVLETLSRCTRIVVVSAALGRLIVQHGIADDRIDVVENGVDRTLFRPIPRDRARQALRLPRHGKLLVCSAYLVPIKGHRVLLHAFQLLRTGPGADATLVLLGDGPLRRELTREAQRLGVADHVLFAGRRPHPEVPLWINASDAVCLASLNEGLPNALIEALACGRPVVATRVGGVPELITSDEYGRLVRSGDSATMAEALNDVLARSWDPGTVSACPQLISWEASAERLLAALRRACAPV